MDTLEKDIEQFLKLINAEENDWDIECLEKIGYGTMFFKYLQDASESKHYFKCLVQDSLSIVDAVSRKSQRYFYFILRSYIENFFRVLLRLEDTDDSGVIKIFSKGKKLIEKNNEPSEHYKILEEAYSECCLFVHSNVASADEINEFLKNILERNDFAESGKVNEFFAEFKQILNTCIIVFLICHTEFVDSSFYRKKETLKKIIGESNYQLFQERIIKK